MGLCRAFGEIVQAKPSCAKRVTRSKALNFLSPKNKEIRADVASRTKIVSLKKSICEHRPLKTKRKSYNCSVGPPEIFGPPAASTVWPLTTASRLVEKGKPRTFCGSLRSYL